LKCRECNTSNYPITPNLLPPLMKTRKTSTDNQSETRKRCKTDYDWSKHQGKKWKLDAS
jgi:hypothetical protein